MIRVGVLDCTEMATIDTLALAERLERETATIPSGPVRYARILGDMAAASDVATKQDLRIEIGSCGHEMQHEIGQLRTEMHEMEARLRLEIQSEGNKLRAELHKEIAPCAATWAISPGRWPGSWSPRPRVIIALIRLLPGGTP